MGRIVSADGLPRAHLWVHVHPFTARPGRQWPRLGSTCFSSQILSDQLRILLASCTGNHSGALPWDPGQTLAAALAVTPHTVGPSGNGLSPPHTVHSPRSHGKSHSSLCPQRSGQGKAQSRCPVMPVERENGLEIFHFLYLDYHSLPIPTSLAIPAQHFAFPLLPVSRAHRPPQCLTWEVLGQNTAPPRTSGRPWLFCFTLEFHPVPQAANPEGRA